MQNPTYLIRSERAVFYFRWPLPQPLLPNNKRRYVKLSLHTREPKEALYLAKGLAYLADNVVKQRWVRDMEYQQIRVIVQDYCQKFLEGKKRGILENGLLSPAEIEGYQHTVDNAGLIAGLDDAGLRMDYDSGIRKMLADSQVEIIAGSAEHEQLRKIYMAAMPAICAELIRFNREQAGFDFKPSVQQVEAVPSSVKPLNANLPTLAKAAEKFVAAYVGDGAWDDNTKNDREAKLAVLVEILGADYPVAAMDVAKAREIRDLIKQLPKNMNKNPLVRGKSLQEAIAMQDVGKLSAVTVQKYLNVYHSLYQWCVDEGAASSNPFSNLKATVDKKKQGDPRKPFNAEQVRKIQAAIQDEKKHYRYWGTLIGMYTGARLNEVAQIMLDDIKQEEGIWYFHMNDDGENQKLKTPAARRLVPIHPKLLGFGILDEVERLRKQGKTRFLHELTYCKKNGYGKKLGHFFNQVLLVKLGIKSKELVFHSLRHTVITRLYQAGVAQPIIEMLVGHERSGTSQQVYFKEGYTLAQLQDAIDCYSTA